MGRAALEAVSHACAAGGRPAAGTGQSPGDGRAAGRWPGGRRPVGRADSRVRAGGCRAANPRPPAAIGRARLARSASARRDHRHAGRAAGSGGGSGVAGLAGG
ncbi:hypothetical protein G6F22_013262 [Rhizopus arrhizus]|nr:hypothetical protein G6F22_013262 [Rhizopus arrhizus]